MKLETVQTARSKQRMGHVSTVHLATTLIIIYCSCSIKSEICCSNCERCSGTRSYGYRCQVSCIKKGGVQYSLVKNVRGYIIHYAL